MTQTRGDGLGSSDDQFREMFFEEARDLPDPRQMVNARAEEGYYGASEARWQRGQPAGPVDGVPTMLKENIATQGVAVPLGTAATELAIAAYELTRTQMGGIGAARLLGNRCEGCHLEIPSAELEAVRRAPEDAVVTCPECGRILVR